MGFALVTGISACGGGGNTVGTVTIRNPTSAGAFQTDQALIYLNGTSFGPTRTGTDIFGHPMITLSYTVVARNDTTGQQVAGWPSGGSDLVTWSVWDVPLVSGANHILVLAHDEGIDGQAVIVINRVPDVTPRTSRACILPTE
jgi:hypothetical protein